VVISPVANSSTTTVTFEIQTAIILRKVKKAHENGDAGICHTQVEKNKLRKFLFVMNTEAPVPLGNTSLGIHKHTHQRINIF
jgi:hypothetical protein